jgi:hypothetical protein
MKTLVTYEDHQGQNACDLYDDITINNSWLHALMRNAMRASKAVLGLNELEGNFFRRAKAQTCECGKILAVGGPRMGANQCAHSSARDT